MELLVTVSEAEQNKCGDFTHTISSNRFMQVSLVDLDRRWATTQANFPINDRRRLHLWKASEMSHLNSQTRTSTGLAFHIF